MAFLFQLPFHVLKEVEQDEPLVDIDLGRLVQAMRTSNLNCVLVEELRGSLDNPGQLLSHVFLALALGARDAELVLTPLIVCKES
jgi:hypothetical protein